MQDAAELYAVPYWGTGYFRLNKAGKMETTPSSAQGPGVVIQDVVDQLVARGESLPLILRFPQILSSRVRQLNSAFRNAISEYEYPGRYQGVFPIKVNQRRMVVETVAAAGWDFAHGLEAGSKAELALCLAQDMNDDALLCCNGYKDDGYVRLALMGRKLGKNVVITLEKFSELERVLRLAQEVGVKPAIGVRFKLHARGSGQWEESGGDQAKFGLNATELLAVVRRLQASGQLDALVMLHCHVGSQITDVRKIKLAVREAAQTYAELRELGVNVRYLNVGGGLAVDYDGSKTTFYASANYTVQEYANEIVYGILETCKSAEVEVYPTIVSESGRALTAHHAVLVIPVVDVTGPTRFETELEPRDAEQHSLITDFEELLESVTLKNYREAYYDAVANKDTMHNLFDLGYLSLKDRARGEMLFFRIAEKVQRVIADLKYVPDEFEDLPVLLSDKYICNFSLFQSLPDHWAIQALFPVVPLARLNERPTRRATIVDISCDSDGKMEKFVDLRDVKNTLPLHEPRPGEPYYLGVFLMGAYQDVLGSAHNLFGKVNEAHVRVTPDGEPQIELFVRGQKARRVIESMGYEAPDLSGHVELDVTRAMKAGLVNATEAETFMELYNEELVGYTYLED